MFAGEDKKWWSMIHSFNESSIYSFTTLRVIQSMHYVQGIFIKNLAVFIKITGRNYFATYATINRRRPIIRLIHLLLSFLRFECQHVLRSPGLPLEQPINAWLACYLPVFLETIVIQENNASKVLFKPASCSSSLRDFFSGRKALIYNLASPGIFPSPPLLLPYSFLTMFWKWASNWSDGCTQQ